MARPVRSTAAATARPFSRADPACPEDNPFCDRAHRAPDPTDLCFVSDENLARAERDARSAATGRAVPRSPWDGRSRPEHLDKVDAHFHLTDAEHALLANNGLVVLDRVPFASYAAAFHDVFQEQLPVYVGVDAVLYAIGRDTELALETVERKRLVPAVARLLQKLRGTLAASRGRYTRETHEDLDVYLDVAWGLLRPDAARPKGQAAELLEAARASTEMATVTLFGRERVVDFSQLTPRGHYTGGDLDKASLENYFRAVMWLSRTEMNLVSRSSASSSPTLAPAETPREGLLAIALADLAERSSANVELAAFEEVYGAFAGAREDVPLGEVARLAREGGLRPNDPEAAGKLRAAIGDRFRRKARTHFTAEGARELPAIATMLGPRVVPDVAPMTRLVHDAVPERYDLGAADVGFLLGHERARAHLAGDLARFPGLGTALASGRDELANEAAKKGDLYGSWLRAILALGQAPPETAPSYTRTPGYADFRMGSALAGFAQLRHAYALLAAQGYDAYGCEIPDGWVETVPAFWDALLAHVKNVGKLAPGTTRAKERVLTMLRDIARTEASGAPLSEPQRRWLGMVSENVPVGGYGGDSGAPPKWTGWYFDLFSDRHNGATAAPALVADVMTLTTAGHVRYLGTDGPRLAVFVVDTGGRPRVVVGPVAKGWETTSSLEGERLDDKAAATLTSKTASWRATFASLERPAPALGLESAMADCGDAKDPSAPVEIRIALRAETRVGKVTVTLRDHHGDASLAAATAEIGDEWTTYAFELPPAFRGPGDGVAALDVHVHELAVSGTGTGPYHHTTTPSRFEAGQLAGMGTFALPERPKGLENFVIGGAGTPDVKGRPRPTLRRYRQDALDVVGGGF